MTRGAGFGLRIYTNNRSAKDEICCRNEEGFGVMIRGRGVGYGMEGNYDRT
jgi:hypothetical protein